MNVYGPQRCLLIAPLSFYSFHLDVVAALERRGYVVETLNEEFPANALGKVLGKICLPLLRRFTLFGLRKRLAGRPRYNLIVIIKGRGIGREAIRWLKERADYVVGYNFDSFRFNPSPLSWHDLTDRYATFDIIDAKCFGLPLVHLFSAAEGTKEQRRDIALSVVMRVHSDRLIYVDRILRALPGHPVSVFLFVSSRIILALHALRAPLTVWRLRHHISFKPLPYPEAMGLIARSHTTLDYAHPLQSGITVRCHEAQSLGVAVITNNPHVEASGIFPAGSIGTFPLDGDVGRLPALVESLSRAGIAPKQRGSDIFIAELLGDLSGRSRRGDKS
ncbi:MULTISPECIES: hypothetical protein [unclassified Sphingomonas]|uniref:hypothetical protein n=1 Tax=unclassified Sphingomonas TaxID=196159 RepID=UPI000A8F0239|nr:MULTISPECIES: hypothetical protein [unclassified Sphingomonas]